MTASIDAHGPSDPRLEDRNEALGSALPPDKPPPRLAWIPIRSLGPGHRPRILEHLLALSEHDRYLRFGFPAADAQIERYVEGLDFERDEVFGVFNRRLKLIALAHLAHPSDEQAGGAAEFGGSVSSHLRGRGYGARLFEHAMLHARNRGIDTLFIHALSENTAMLRIARRAGAVVERAGSESDATLKLPPETLASQVEQFVGESAAALDYQLKQQARAVDAFIDALAEVRSGVGKSGPAKD
ncbi:GNAT family N-acetyltransferase [Aquincola sp. S2]|uniref:GNAT family N-acetyltransferase n=1 Tax=Pseudaquabacterium terrae TaxID=2732868 RepID=A0ABX2EBM7_9BURK|nr:GNAT family N-acetyltransferase [Aquabacterium terrae]NRF66549.1 GNAT family N-acetyltransferase [Aquabacterium terrae]